MMNRQPGKRNLSNPLLPHASFLEHPNNTTSYSSRASLSMMNHPTTNPTSIPIPNMTTRISGSSGSGTTTPSITMTRKTSNTADVIYGRGKEELQLDRIIDQSKRYGTQFVILHGITGCGKTSLIESKKKIWIQDKHAFFISVKFPNNTNSLPTSSSSSSSPPIKEKKKMDEKEEEEVAMMMMGENVATDPKTKKSHTTNEKKSQQQQVQQRPGNTVIVALEELCRTWSASDNGKQEIEDYLEMVRQEERKLSTKLPELFQKSTAQYSKNINPWSITVDVDVVEGDNDNDDEGDCTACSPSSSMSCAYKTKRALGLLLSGMCSQQQPHQPRTTTRRTSSRPVILFFDDFQFADPVSLDIIQFLIHQSVYTGNQQEPIKGLVIIVAYRDRRDDEHEEEGQQNYSGGPRRRESILGETVGGGKIHSCIVANNNNKGRETWRKDHSSSDCSSNSSTASTTSRQSEDHHHHHHHPEVSDEDLSSQLELNCITPSYDREEKDESPAMEFLRSLQQHEQKQQSQQEPSSGKLVTGINGAGAGGDCGERITTIHLHDLSLPGVCDLLLGLLGREEEETQSLAKVIYHKTGGNPLLVCQFLEVLQKEGFVFYCVRMSQWEWTDIEQMTRATSIASERVAQEITVSLKDKLSKDTKDALMVASCLGHRVPFVVLQQFFEIISGVEDSDDDDEGKDQEDEKQAPLPPSLSLDDSGDEENSSDDLNRSSMTLTPKTCQNASAASSLHGSTIDHLERVLEKAVQMDVLTHRTGSTTWYWSHGVIQESVYRMIPTRDRAKWHLKLGKLLWKMRHQFHDQEWLMYMATDQFAKVSSLVSDKAMRASLTKLNLEGAKRCISTSALEPASKILKNGIRLLDPETRWRDHYELCVDIFSHLAEISYLLGDHNASKKASHEVLKNVKNQADRRRVSLTKIQLIAAGPSRDYESAMRKTLVLLAEQGIKVPSNTVQAHLLHAMSGPRSKKSMPRPDLYKMTNRTDVRISKLLSMLSLYALYAGKSALAQYAVLRSTRLSMSSGISIYSSTATAVHGVLLIGEGKVAEGVTHGHFALKMLGLFEDEEPGEFHVRTLQLVHSGIFHAVQPFHTSLDVFMNCHQLGLTTKDVEHGILSGMHYSLCYFAVGLPVGPLETDLLAFTDEAKQFGLAPSIEACFRIFRQTILNLQGQATNLTMLKGNAMDRKEILLSMKGAGRSMTRRDIATFELMLACIYGDVETMAKLLATLEAYPMTDTVVSRTQIRLTFMGLAAFELCCKKGGQMKASKYQSLGRKIMKYFQVAAKNGSVNAHPVALCLQAEDRPCKPNYIQAIRACGRIGLIHLEAMMNERAGIFFLGQGDKIQAMYHLARAVCLYQDWGALGKVSQLRFEHEFTELAHAPASGRSTTMKARRRTSISDTARLRKFEHWHSLRLSQLNVLGPEATSGTRDSMRATPRRGESSLALSRIRLSQIDFDSARTLLSSTGTSDASLGMESVPEEEAESERKTIFPKLNLMPTRMKEARLPSTEELPEEEPNKLLPRLHMMNPAILSRRQLSSVEESLHSEREGLLLVRSLRTLNTWGENPEEGSATRPSLFKMMSLHIPRNKSTRPPDDSSRSMPFTLDSQESKRGGIFSVRSNRKLGMLGEDADEPAPRPSLFQRMSFKRPRKNPSPPDELSNNMGKKAQPQSVTDGICSSRSNHRLDIVGEDDPDDDLPQSDKESTYSWRSNSELGILRAEIEEASPRPSLFTKMSFKMPRKSPRPSEDDSSRIGNKNSSQSNREYMRSNHISGMSGSPAAGEGSKRASLFKMISMQIPRKKPTRPPDDASKSMPFETRRSNTNLGMLGQDAEDEASRARPKLFNKMSFKLPGKMPSLPDDKREN